MKRKYARKEDIPSGFESQFEEKGGEWVLKLDDDGEVARLAEMRESAIRSQKEAKEARERAERLEAEKNALHETYKDIDPEEARKLREMRDQMKSEEEKQLIKLGRYEEFGQRRAAAAVSGMKEQVEAERRAKEKALQDRKEMHTRLSKFMIEQDIQKELGALNVRVKPTAIEDVLARTTRAWRLAEDKTKPEAFTDDGKIMYGEDQTSPITMTEFAKIHLIGKAAHLFEPAGGGGSDGGKKDDAPAGVLRVKRGDTEAVAKNMEKIAKGEAQLVD